MDKYFNLAIDIAKKGVKNNEGGPFGAVIVKNNQIVGVGNNQVIKNNDPTAHAEVMAIRNACQNLNTYDLKDCIIYSTSEPCPMCLSSIIWANIKEVYFSTNRNEIAKIGFRDAKIYDYFNNKNQNIIKMVRIENNQCKDLLNEYKNTIY